MPADGVTLRLVDVEIYGIERDLCFLATANGGQFYVSAPTSDFRAWVARCGGTRTRSELLSGMAPECAEVVDVLLRDGCLRPARAAGDAGRAARLARTAVLLTGAPN
ncbi:hypothetical protein ABZ691_33815 [Streptomyces sp. NPDC006854]|uniref:hypothetical protein n=1 Tax=Streptomyces sp. NPDC006854 TaxID=3155115 RepID=UPI0033C23615